MFTISKKNPYGIEMVEGDYGITLPIIIEPENEEQLGVNDMFEINIYKKANTEPLIEKKYSDITNNTIDFELTEEESNLLPVGIYYYDLDWYNNGTFMCNVIAKQNIRVKEKAGIVNES